jgi:hypothetical protein
MRIRSTLACGFVLFALGDCLAGYPAAGLTIERIRLADELETPHVVFSLHADWADLTLESNSAAVLSHPIGDNALSVSTTVDRREDRGIFSWRIPLADVSDVNGDWLCLINGGNVPSEVLSFSVADIEPAIFPPFPPFPQLGYEGNYSNVYVAFHSTIEYGASLSLGPGHLGNTSVAGGLVYFYPDGGPYRIDLAYTKVISPITIYNSEHEVAVQIEHPHANSKINATVFTGPTDLDFSLSIHRAGERSRITGMGLNTGTWYRLLTSVDLRTWTNHLEFTGPGNAIVLEPNIPSPRQFFMLAH